MSLDWQTCCIDRISLCLLQSSGTFRYLACLVKNLFHNVHYFFGTSSLKRHFMHLPILTLSLQTVAKVTTHSKFQISFCKIPRNECDFAKYLLKGFHLNGNTKGFRHSRRSSSDESFSITRPRSERAKDGPRNSNHILSLLK